MVPRFGRSKRQEQAVFIPVIADYSGHSCTIVARRHCRIQGVPVYFPFYRHAFRHLQILRREDATWRRGVEDILPTPHAPYGDCAEPDYFWRGGVPSACGGFVLVAAQIIFAVARQKSLYGGTYRLYRVCGCACYNERGKDQSGIAVLSCSFYFFARPVGRLHGEPGVTVHRCYYGINSRGSRGFAPEDHILGFDRLHAARMNCNGGK
jgi:hypothetical protein